MRIPILVTGATGKQGGAVVNALLASHSSTLDWTILAVSRDANSASAGKLAAKSDKIKVVEGDQDDVPSLFNSARKVAGQPIWGVFSMQPALSKGTTPEGEIKQGKAMIDESVKAGVKHFVYTSVDRGGDEKSWTNPTNIPHFRSKHEIEQHLRDHCEKMNWTILRPTAFMDNLEPGFQTRVFLAALKNDLRDKPLQMIAASDIGSFASMAFEKPADWGGKALSLAGEDLTVERIESTFRQKSSTVPTPTYSAFGSLLKLAVPDMRHMLNWFASDGYGANISHIKHLKPDVMDLGDWIEKESRFPHK